MRRIAIGVFLSFFVSMINAAGMPIELNPVDAPVQGISQDHCHTIAEANHHDDDSASQSTSGVNHYCCSVVAVLTSSVVFGRIDQAGIPLTAENAVPIFNIAESIYKPPRNYL